MARKSVKKKAVQETKTPDKAQVVGISGSVPFWAAVNKYAKKTGVTRSAVIVQAVISALGLKESKVGSKAVGRPRKSVKKVMKK